MKRIKTLIMLAAVFVLFESGSAFANGASPVYSSEPGQNAGAAAQDVYIDDSGTRIAEFLIKDEVYDIHVYYPETQSRIINDSVYDFVMSRVSSFKREQDSGWLMLRCASYQYGENAIGFVFTEHSEKNGLVILRRRYALQYETVSGQRLGLNQIFREGCDYESVLYPLCVYELESQKLPADEAKTLLAKAGYENFVIDKGNISFILNTDYDYYELTIPLSELEGIWNIDEFFDSFYEERTDGDDLPELPEEINTPQSPAFNQTSPAYDDRFNGRLFTEREAGKRYIALTFDDGPHMKNTPKLLDILKRYDAKATFFLLGHRAAAMPDIARRIAAEGNEIGNHTYNHLQLSAISEANINLQIDKTNEALYELTGEKTKLLRPPFGARNKTVMECAAKNGMSVILWDIDPRDWTVKDANAIAAHVIRKANDSSIILLHDIYKTTVEATEIIIKELSAKGYEFLTVTDLINMNYDIINGAVYRNAKEVVTK